MATGSGWHKAGKSAPHPHHNPAVFLAWRTSTLNPKPPRPLASEGHPKEERGGVPPSVHSVHAPADAWATRGQVTREESQLKTKEVGMESDAAPGENSTEIP